MLQGCKVKTNPGSTRRPYISGTLFKKEVEVNRYW